jgi:hypothetical protein
MLTYLCNIIKRLDRIEHLLKEISQKHDETLKRMDRIEESLKN